jgi:hypothetical protein
MEARASFGRTGTSKGLIAAVAVSITLGLAVMAATVVKNVSGSPATQTHAVVVQSAPSYARPAQRGGQQEYDGSATSSAKAALPRPGAGHGRLP